MRRLAGLASVVVLLGAYLLFGHRDTGGGPGASVHARLIDAFVFDRAAVQTITIARAGVPPFSLVRQPPGQEPAWRESPGDLAADAPAVEDLLSAIDLAETTRTADVSAAAAGLAPPRVTIALGAPRGPVTIELGQRDAAGRGVFTRVGGAPAIRVAPVRLIDLVDREPWAFRDRRLVPLFAEAITAISWREAETGSEHRLRLDGGRWQNAENQRLAPERMTEVLRRLLALRATRFDTPRLLPASVPGIDVAAKDGVTVHLALPDEACAAPDGARVEREEPGGAAGACVSSEALGELWHALAAAAVPDLRLVAAPPETVTRVEVEEEGRQLRLLVARTPGGAWRIEAPKVAYPADPKAIVDWLEALRGVETDPLPATSSSRSPPPPHVRRLTIDGRAREVAEISPGDPGYALADPDPLRLRDRAVLDFAHFDARELRRSDADGAVALTSADGDAWRVVVPAGAAADRTNVARVVGALGNLRVEAFAAKPLAGPPELTLDVAVQAPGEHAPTRHTLEVHKRKEAPGCTGRLDHDVAFTLEEAVCDELRLGLLK
jgi:Domain of unknown function (DUF4340)